MVTCCEKYLVLTSQNHVGISSNLLNYKGVLIFSIALVLFSLCVLSTHSFYCYVTFCFSVYLSRKENCWNIWRCTL